MSSQPADAPGAGSGCGDTDDWLQVLDAVEADIAEAEAALAADRLPESTSYVLPTRLGPPPAELADRAWAAHDRAVSVSTTLADAAARTSGALSALAAQRTEGRTSHYVDARC